MSSEPHKYNEKDTIEKDENNQPDDLDEIA